MSDNPRDRLGRTLTGDVLEVGPGHIPFPTAPDARVVYADRSVPGGRDATWPELRGAPHGPEAQFDVNLDVDGLAGVADGSHDVVIACHVIEHLANPVATLREFERVLRPGGRLVLVVPDRHRTFDAVRPPTTWAHVLAEFEAGTTEVDDAHIREFCEAIHSQPPMHPDEVREWHDPDALTPERFDLHRRRSIHVHCWDAEEFAAFVAASLEADLGSWRLDQVFFSDDVVDEPSIEFGLVLERAPRGSDTSDATGAQGPRDRADRFVRDWVDCVLSDPTRDPARVARFGAALGRDHGADVDLLALPALLLAEELTDQRAAAAELATRAEAELRAAADRTTEAERQVESLRNGRSYRAGRLLGAPVRLARRGSAG